MDRSLEEDRMFCTKKKVQKAANTAHCAFFVLVYPLNPIIDCQKTNDVRECHKITLIFQTEPTNNGRYATPSKSIVKTQ